MINKILEWAKAIVAFFSGALTYIVGQLATSKPVNWGLAASYLLSAILVWSTPNKPPANETT